MNCPDPIEAMCHVIRGYHEVFPITETEIEILFPLITARLLITVSSSAYNKHHEPENEYLIISEKPAWELLIKLRLIDNNFIHFSFRKSCGFVPNPKRILFDQWVLKNQEQLHPPIDLPGAHIFELDLSVGSLDLGNCSNYHSISNFSKTVSRLLEDNQADTGVGGYGEIRSIYTTDAYREEGNSGSRWRSVHLGLDIWQPAGSPNLFTTKWHRLVLLRQSW